MNLMLAFLSFAKPLKMSSPINKELKAALRWLTTVFQLSKMTQVTSRSNKNHFSTRKALNPFGPCIQA